MPLDMDISSDGLTKWIKYKTIQKNHTYVFERAILINTMEENIRRNVKDLLFCPKYDKITLFEII